MADVADLKAAENLVLDLVGQGIGLAVEGADLLVHGHREMLTVESREKLVASKPLLLEWFRRQGIEAAHRPSYGQRGLFHVQQLAPSSSAYNIAVAARIVSAVDEQALDASLVELVKRHHALRSAWTSIRGHEFVGVEPAPKSILLRGNAPKTKEARRAVMLEALRAPFDLCSAPMLRAWLFTRDSQDHDFIIVVHHMAADFWALRPLLEELRAFYEAFAGGKQSTLPPPVAQPLDLVSWEAHALANDKGRAAESYWRQRLSPPPPALEMPVDHSRPRMRELRGGSETFEVGSELLDALRRTARASGTTLFVLMLSAFQALLHRYSGQQDIVVGTPVARREDARLASVVGYVANLVPVRTSFVGDPTFAQVIVQTRDAVLDALEHASYPFPFMVESLRQAVDFSRPPLCQAVFALHNIGHLGPIAALFRRSDESAPIDFGGLQLQPLLLEQQEGQFDLAMELIEESETVVGTLSFDASLFEPPTAARIVKHYLALLGEVVRNTNRATSALPLAKELVSVGHETVFIDESQSALIHRRFERMAATRREAVALVSEGATLTYAELDARSSAVAARLRALGAGPDVRVGLAIERGIEMIVGILGILKSGAAYVPLDPTYPRERLVYMLEDAMPAALVASTTAAHALPRTTLPILLLDELPSLAPGAIAVEPHPDNAAYVMYTSGSSGRPKGVVVTHRNVTQLFDNTRQRFDFGPNDVGVVCHSFAFDFSTWEIWGALFYGGKLVLPDSDVTRSATDLAACLARHAVTVLNQTPTSFLSLSSAILSLAPRGLSCLRLVMFGGEALDYGALRRWFDCYGDQSPELVNLFGITETTVHVTGRRVRSSDADQPVAGSLIGLPLPNIRLHLLDGTMQPVPVGVVGEIYIGGSGVSRGYWKQPALTAQRYVPDPFADGPGRRLYRSGDLARLRDSGEVEYLGRIDQQVQLRGVRIELPEIEAVLRRHESVGSAVVNVVGDTAETQRLVAYVVPRAGRDVDPIELLELCRAALPRTMVPSAFLLLDALPLTTTGKLDRTALPTGDQQFVRISPPIEPRNSTEAMLTAIWRALLKAKVVGVEDDFFELGGNSLLATQLTSCVRDAFGVSLPLELLFHTPTVARQAEFLSALKAVTSADLLPTAGEHEEVAF